jgi:virulence factor Mce-like protein
MRKQRTASAWANPTLVGAVTVLFALVAVFLAYSANQGLPFVPTTELKVDIADGSNLTVGNDVREGGFRVGFVSALTPVELPDGTTVAQLTLKLSKSDAAVPVDSHVEIRARSVLGLKYIDLIKGTSSQLIADGGTLPIGHTTVPVQFDQIFNTFDPKTRQAIKTDLVESGDLLAGRGSDLNSTIQDLPPLLQHLTPVARYLSDPATGLTNFFDALNRFTSALAPVAQTGARLFTEMATTFQAISSNATEYQATIADSPSTLAVSTDSLRAQQPLLADLTTFGTDLSPATAALHRALPLINPALEAGTRTLKRTPALNTRLQGVMRQLKSLAQAPGTDIAINALSGTVQTLNPTIRYLGPYVTVCNDWNYWWTYLADLVSERTNFGTAQRALFNLADLAQTNNVNSQGAYAPVNGGGSTNLTGGNEFLHIQPYGAAIDSQGSADCETGQRGYPLKLNYFDPLGRNLATDSHTPGDQGPTFGGRAHVPAGETFSRNPQIGPQLLPNPTNP